MWADASPYAEIPAPVDETARPAVPPGVGSPRGRARAVTVCVRLGYENQPHAQPNITKDFLHFRTVRF